MGIQHYSRIPALETGQPDAVWAVAFEDIRSTSSWLSNFWVRIVRTEMSLLQFQNQRCHRRFEWPYTSWPDQVAWVYERHRNRFPTSFGPLGVALSSGLADFFGISWPLRKLHWGENLSAKLWREEVTSAFGLCKIFVHFCSTCFQFTRLQVFFLSCDSFYPSPSVVDFVVPSWTSTSPTSTPFGAMTSADHLGLVISTSCDFSRLQV